jgi:2-polyprenyl-6-methoxyphenol hydroxylase-like FAD-dependent oxidoreductase
VTAADDRQVLVVGDGVAGLAVTATLRRAGYDPVVLGDGNRTSTSRVAVLHPLARTIFDDLTGEQTWTGDPGTSDSGTVRLDRRADSNGNGTGRRRPPVAIATDAVRSRLAVTVPDSAIREDGVRDLHREGDALRVRFESGVREWFDLVVAADGPGSTVRAVRDATLHTDHAVQAEARLDGGRETPPTRRETWTEHGLVETVSYPDGDTHVRLTSSTLAADEHPPTDRVCRALGTLGRTDETPDASTSEGENEDHGPPGRVGQFELVDVRETEVAQCRLDGGHWGDGRVAYCGGAALPQVPATGLATTFALADGRVLVDELVAGPSAVADAVEAYGRRRRRYADRFRETTESSSGDEGDANTALASLRRFRSAKAGGGVLLTDIDTL